MTTHRDREAPSVSGCIFLLAVVGVALLCLGAAIYAIATPA